MVSGVVVQQQQEETREVTEKNKETILDQVSPQRSSAAEFFRQVRQAIQNKTDPFAVAQPPRDFVVTRPMVKSYDPKCRHTG